MSRYLTAREVAPLSVLRKEESLRPKTMTSFFNNLSQTMMGLQVLDN